MSSSPRPERGGVDGFRGRVNFKLAVLVGLSFFGVILLGVTSIFFARSIHVAAEETRQEHYESEVANRIHNASHHFIFALHRALILSRPVPENVRSSYRDAMSELLNREHSYHGIPREQEVVDEIGRLSDELLKLSESLSMDAEEVDMAAYRERLDRLENHEASIQGLAHTLNIAHSSRMDFLLERNRSSMHWIFTFYAVFFLLGALVVIGSSLYFGRTIVRPLRWLSHAANEVAQGNIQHKIPVISNDEIGLLTHTFNVMFDELRTHEAKQRQLTILEERERIAAELHDSLAQSLALLNIKLNEHEARHGNGGANHGGSDIEEMHAIINDAYDDVRQAIYGLRASRLNEGRFIDNMTELLRSYGAMRKLSVDVRIEEPVEFRFGAQEEVQLIRILQEALTNVSRHADASRCIVTFARDRDHAEITVVDDGMGFQTRRADGDGFHFGLRTMRERTQAVGGEFAVQSAPGAGTCVTIRLPLAASGPHEADTNPAG